jgi:hypothetical protein
MPLPKSWPLLKDFITYCVDHPDLRFWQALRSWSKWHYIYASENGQESKHLELYDTFYWEETMKPPEEAKTHDPQ